MVCGAPSSGTSTTLFGGRTRSRFVHPVHLHLLRHFRPQAGQHHALRGDRRGRPRQNDHPLPARRRGRDGTRPRQGRGNGQGVFHRCRRVAARRRGPRQGRGLGGRADGAMGGAEAVATSLKGMLSQRLIRVLCKDCKQAYKPNPDFLKKAGSPQPSPTSTANRPAATTIPTWTFATTVAVWASRVARGCSSSSR